MTTKVYLVVGAVNSPGRVFGVFDDYAVAVDYRDTYLSDEASVEEFNLYSAIPKRVPRTRVLP